MGGLDVGRGSEGEGQLSSRHYYGVEVVKLDEWIDKRRRLSEY